MCIYITYMYIYETCVESYNIYPYTEGIVLLQTITFNFFKESRILKERRMFLSVWDVWVSFSHSHHSEMKWNCGKEIEAAYSVENVWNALQK